MNDQFQLQTEHIRAGGHEVAQYIQRKGYYQCLLRQAQLSKHNGVAGQGTAGDGGSGDGQQHAGEDGEDEPHHGAFHTIDLRRIDADDDKIEGGAGREHNDAKRYAEAHNVFTDTKLFPQVLTQVPKEAAEEAVVMPMTAGGRTFFSTRRGLTLFCSAA